MFLFYTGFSIPTITTENGVRESSAEAFIKPNLRKRNFHVLVKAFVTEVNNIGWFNERRARLDTLFWHSGEGGTTLITTLPLDHQEAIQFRAAEKEIDQDHGLGSNHGPPDSQADSLVVEQWAVRLFLSQRR